MGGQRSEGEGKGRGEERKDRGEDEGREKGKGGREFVLWPRKKKKSRRLCLCERGTGGSAPIHHMAHGQRDVNNMI